MTNHLIYRPKGPAGEYAHWACNLHVGCSNRCDYCYNRKGILANQLGGEDPTPKKAPGAGEARILNCFARELDAYRAAILADGGGLFFSFTTDPCLPQTFPLTLRCAMMAMNAGVPVRLLTKSTSWLGEAEPLLRHGEARRLVAVGFTLTGCDDREPGAATNMERIAAMRRLHEEYSLRTFASIEPVIDPMRSWAMISSSFPVCDLYMVGLLNHAGHRYADGEVERLVEYISAASYIRAPFYLKDSVLRHLGWHRSDLSGRRFVTSDYDIFNHKQKRIYTI